MRKVKLYSFIIIYWLLAMTVLSLFTRANLNSFLEILNTKAEILNNPLMNYWISPYQTIESIIMGLFFGFLFIGIHECSVRINLNRKGFGTVIFFKSLMYLVGFTLSAIVAFSLISNFEIFPKESIQKISNIKALVRVGVIGLVYIMYQTVLLNFLVQTVEKFGLNNLWHFLIGKYRTPKVEDRVFLFIDLKSSTTLAEELGTIKYSQLIRDSFADINHLVDKYRANIYQYVGDEVVLSWQSKYVLKKHNPIKLFYAVEHLIQKRKKQYLKKYNVIPEFKAGLHGGLVTVTEIGNIKREIAYHGDVLNTTSRIEQLCNEYSEKLLISGDLLSRMGGLNGYVSKPMGEITLKGKINAVEVHAIKPI